MEWSFQPLNFSRYYLLTIIDYNCKHWQWSYFIRFAKPRIGLRSQIFCNVLYRKYFFYLWGHSLSRWGNIFQGSTSSLTSSLSLLDSIIASFVWQCSETQLFTKAVGCPPLKCRIKLTISLFLSWERKLLLGRLFFKFASLQIGSQGCFQLNEMPTCLRYHRWKYPMASWRVMLPRITWEHREYFRHKHNTFHCSTQT